MKALIICGSANLSGTSSAAAEYAADSLNGIGIGTELLFPSLMRIGHCSGCGKCRNGDCPLKDDMKIILEKASESDILLFAFPVHFSGPSSLVKTVIDRFQPCWYTKKIHAKTAALICGGSPEPRFACSVTVLRALCITAGMEWKGCLEIPGTDKKDASGLRSAVEGFIAATFGT